MKKVKTFKQYVETIGTNCLVLIHKAKNEDGEDQHEHYEAKIDKPGWFGGQWFEVPEDVEITESDLKHYGGI